MGTFVDFFKPIFGSTLFEMITSNGKHLWSSDATGTYIQPLYDIHQLGGSALDESSTAAPTGSRYLSLWGTSCQSVVGRCLSDINDPFPWGQSFTMELLQSEASTDTTTVKSPSALAIMLLGMGGLFMARRKNSQDEKSI